MRGFVYNLTINVNKKNLLRVKETCGITDDYAFENPVQKTPARQGTRSVQVCSFYKFQPPGQQLQGMQHLDL